MTLTLEPTPGLTVVAGRNGSGKSSIAEGLELLLTGMTYRWKNKKSTQWSEQWRNLHHDGPTEITAEIVEEGSGPLTLRTRWDPGAGDVADHTTTVHRTVDGRRGPAQDASVLGWASSLDTYRPMLSYDELGGLLESGPSELYDAIAKVLGTELLAQALARIKNRLSLAATPLKTAKTERKSLQADAAALDDERAQAVASLMKKTSPDTGQVRELATGVTLPDRGVVGSLRALTQLQSPDPVVVSRTAQRVRSAVTAMADAGETEAARRIARLDVRRQALQLHAAHGEQTCPVCNASTLDAACRAASSSALASDNS